MICIIKNCMVKEVKMQKRKKYFADDFIFSAKNTNIGCPCEKGEASG